MAGKKTKEKKDSKKGSKKTALSTTGRSSKGSRASKLGAVVAGAAKTYGHRVVHRASKTEALIVPRVSTGLYGLDLKTNGGFPLRRVLGIYGLESSAKTSMLLRAVGNAQRLCANCLEQGEFKEGQIEFPDLENPGPDKSVKVDTWVIYDCPCGNPKDFIVLWEDAEHVWLPEWGERMGAWPEKMMLMRPEFGEAGYDVAVSMMITGEMDLVAVDSLAALIPEGEWQASMQQQHQGLAARVNNKGFRKVISAMNECWNKTAKAPSFWTINQYRQKIGVMFGPSEVVPGGMGQKFVNTIEIECRKGKLNKDDETDDILSGTFGYHVKKNKVGVEGGRGEYKMCKTETDFLRVGDLMEHEEVIDAAVDLGLIERDGSVMYIFDGEKFRGKGKMQLHFIEHSDIYEDLKAKMLRYRLGIREDG